MRGETLRTFAALDLDPEPRAACAAYLETLKHAAETGVKWVLPDHFHLTLRFFGDLLPENVKSIGRMLGETALETPRFDFRLEGTGAFPDLVHPKVIWIGIADGSKNISEFASKIEEGAVHIEIPKEVKTFSPHLTVGRVRSQNNLRYLRDFIKGHPFRFEGVSSAKHLTLYRSRLMPDGPHYEILEKHPLA